MEKILDRYERHSYADRRFPENDQDAHGSWMVHAKLKSRLEILQKSQRHIMGEDLDYLNLKELQNLEHQLDTALKHIRLRKNQLMFDSISVLQKKDKALKNQNSLLSKKIKEVEKEVAILPVERQIEKNMLTINFDSYIRLASLFLAICK
ncbi:agamous-like MADS-box protein AGL8 homolog [Rutidosis leptorrhynchoides]|uniref:agamous-like MADS-box protein AGL8 homolog n=1 Tax=Rutidosis leptorrhynchoides TaxID=125765 RepID=UPI003A9A61CE